MQLIPIQAEPNQSVTVGLANQRCQINLYSKLGRMFADLYVADSLVVAGTLVLDRNLLVRSAYLNFVGDLCVIDTQGTNDPTFDGLGARYQLAYIENSELSSPRSVIAGVSYSAAVSRGGSYPVQTPTTPGAAGQVLTAAAVAALLPSLPTTLPLIPGQPWNNGGLLSWS